MLNWEKRILISGTPWYTSCSIYCHFIAACRWFSMGTPDSSTNKKSLQIIKE